MWVISSRHRYIKKREKLGALFAHDSNFELIEIKKLTSHRIRESIETDAGQNIFCGFGRCIKCEKLRWRGILVALRDGIKCENFGWTWTGRMKDWVGGWRGKLGLGLSRLVTNFFSHHLHWSECVNCNSLTKYKRNPCRPNYMSWSSKPNWLLKAC